MPINLGGNELTTTGVRLLNDTGIVTSGSVLFLDAGTATSYPGSGTTWSDLSGNGYDSSLVNGPTYNSSNLGSIVFDGSNDTVNVGNFFTYSNFTIFTWLYPGSSQVEYADIFDNDHRGDRNFVCQQNTTNTNKYGFDCINATTGSSAVFTLPANVWTQMTFTWNNSTARAYMTGSFSSAGSPMSSILYSSQYLRIASWGGGGRNWNGRVGMFVAYNRVLSDTEILQNFNATRQRYGI